MACHQRTNSSCPGVRPSHQAGAEDRSGGGSRGRYSGRVPAQSARGHVSDPGDGR